MMSNTHPRVFALLLTLFFFSLVYLYYREFPIFGNTIGIKSLAIGSALIVLGLSGAVIWRWRNRFQPWDRHLPELFFLLIFPALFAPLFGSLLNRGLGKSGHQSFEFISETPYMAEAYGLLKGETPKVSGYNLRVKAGSKAYRFRYKERAYPITQPGEVVYLPVRWGLFGATVVQLK